MLSTQPDHEQVIARAKHLIVENNDSEQDPFTSRYILAVLISEFPGISQDEYMHQIDLLLTEHHKSLLAKSIRDFVKLTHPTEKFFSRVSNAIDQVDDVEFLIGLEELFKIQQVVLTHTLLSNRVEQIELALEALDRFVKEINQHNPEQPTSFSDLYVLLFPNNTDVVTEVDNYVLALLQNHHMFIDEDKLSSDISQIYGASDLQDIMARLNKLPLVRLHQTLIRRIDELAAQSKLTSASS